MNCWSHSRDAASRIVYLLRQAFRVLAEQAKRKTEAAAAAHPNCCGTAEAEPAGIPAAFGGAT